MVFNSGMAESSVRCLLASACVLGRCTSDEMRIGNGKCFSYSLNGIALFIIVQVRNC